MRVLANTIGGLTKPRTDDVARSVLAEATLATASLGRLAPLGAGGALVHSDLGLVARPGASTTSMTWYGAPLCPLDCGGWRHFQRRVACCPTRRR